MGYYMRFVSTDEKEISLDKINTALKQIDSGYELDFDGEDDEIADLIFSGDIYGMLEIDRPGDDLFDEEIEELKEFLDEVKGDRKSEVLQVLSQAKAIVALQVLQQGRATVEEIFVKIDPLWDWLFANYSGFMQADGEGYYDPRGLVPEVE